MKEEFVTVNRYRIFKPGNPLERKLNRIPRKRKKMLKKAVECWCEILQNIYNKL